MNSDDRIVDNPLLKELHERQREALVARFPALSSCSHGCFLSLEKYLNGTPQQFFVVPVYVEYLEWMSGQDQNNRSQLQACISDHAPEIDRALLHLEEINGYEWHDSFEKNDDYEVIRFIDQRIHPTYLRLVEAVFCPFMRVVAHFSRLNRGKGTEGLDVWSIVQELQGQCFEEALLPYHHIVRNGIAHGGVTYLERAIRYRGKRGNEETYEGSEVVRICDDLLDVCNALALALSIFLLTRHQDGYQLSKQILIEELRAETKLPWWEVVGCTPSQIPGVNQLIIYARSRTSDWGKVQISAFHSGVLAERYAPGFDRYLLSIYGDKSWPGLAIFDGKKLRALREEQCHSLEKYQGVIEKDLVFYVPHIRWPEFVGRFELFLGSFKLHVPQALEDFRKQLGLAEIIVRNSNIHRNSWGCVLNASVYITALTEEVDHDTIRKSCRRIVSNALSCGRQKTSRLSVTRYLPLGFARISVFHNNYRRRRLSNYGLGKDLVCTVQVQRISRIRSPDIFESTIEKHGRYRIAWNQAWLEDIDANPSTTP